MSEFKASSDTSLLQLKKQFEVDLVRLKHNQVEIEHHNQQIKTQIRN